MELGAGLSLDVNVCNNDRNAHICNSRYNYYSKLIITYDDCEIRNAYKYVNCLVIMYSIPYLPGFFQFCLRPHTTLNKNDPPPQKKEIMDAEIGSSEV